MSATAAAQQMLKMSELAERSGVSAGTIRHYLREGLLGDGADIVRTSRNMAYYPAEYVERIALIKRLQQQRFMPLRAEGVGALLGGLAGEVDVERALQIVAAGAEPLRELLGAMHSKLLLAELRRERASLR